MNRIRTIVVDDEPLARIRIIKLLEKFDFIQLITECKNGEEAIEAIDNYKPDLVFLDIQMPDKSGFEVIKGLSGKELPHFIFVTAYDQYAIKAFEVKAVDYLLKPYDEDRFKEALQHAKEQIEMQENADLHQKFLDLIQKTEPEDTPYQTIVELKEKGRTIQIKMDDLLCVEADGNYLRMYEKNKLHLLRETMQNFEEKCDPRIFLRIHRSIIINKNYVKNITYKGNNQYQFLMKNDRKLLSSRGYREDTVAFLDTFEKSLA